MSAPHQRQQVEPSSIADQQQPYQLQGRQAAATGAWLQVSAMSAPPQQ
jgi:hypothetical protein